MSLNVWSCIQRYRTDVAKALLASYGTQEKIVATLDNYPNKNAYHGHQSGAAGQGMNPGASQNLDAAIAYLKQHKPPVGGPPSSSGPNLELKNANQKSNDNLIKIMDEHGNNFATMAEALSARDPNWKLNRVVAGEYKRRYREVKKKDPF
jgi:hypothetical protein